MGKWAKITNMQFTEDELQVTETQGEAQTQYLGKSK